MKTSVDSPEGLAPPNLEKIRVAAREALGKIVPAETPLSKKDLKGLMFSSATDGGRDLPPYYLIYFLMVELLGFSNLGQRKNAAWVIPIRFRGRLYGIEYRDSGPGIFTPNPDPDAGMDTPPAKEAQRESLEIAALIRQALAAADPWFKWRAGQAASGNDLNVVNDSEWLFGRYEFFRDRFRALRVEAEERKGERVITKGAIKDGTPYTSVSVPSLKIEREADWNAQAAMEAFFSWTEHVFIHLSILQGRVRSGGDVARLAEADWKTKLETALDVSDPETGKHQELLSGLHTQVRRVAAQGAFGREGEALWFHSGAGPAPLHLTGDQSHPWSLAGEAALDPAEAISAMEGFIEHLWSGPRGVMQEYIFSGLPAFLLFAADGTYEKAIRSEGYMARFVQNLICQV